MATSALDALRTIQRELTVHGSEPVPPGWLTVDQWSRDARMSSVNAGKILRDGTASGIVEMREFRIATGRGVRNVQHFRVKPTKGKR
jgi:hypothetical protein